MFIFSASFGLIGQYFPIVFVGPIMTKFGKRVSMIIDSTIFLIGFLLVVFSFDIKMIYAAKFFFGRYLN